MGASDLKQEVAKQTVSQLRALQQIDLAEDVAALSAVPAGGERPKSALQIEAARRFREAPAYRILSRRGPDSATVFEAEAAVAGLSATGEGRSKQAAETAAAAALLAKLA